MVVVLQGHQFNIQTIFDVFPPPRIISRPIPSGPKNHQQKIVIFWKKIFFEKFEKYFCRHEKIWTQSYFLWKLRLNDPRDVTKIFTTLKSRKRIIIGLSAEPRRKKTRQNTEKKFLTTKRPLRDIKNREPEELNDENPSWQSGHGMYK